MWYFTALLQSLAQLTELMGNLERVNVNRVAKRHRISLV